MARLIPTFHKASDEPVASFVNVVAESHQTDDGRYLEAGKLVSRKDPALQHNPQFFKRVPAEDVLT